MNPRQVGYFLAVIEQGSITKAAASLHLSQPALTKSLRQLENDVQVPLLERSSRGVHPTVFGECLYEHAKRAETELSRALHDIEILRGARSGSVAVGAVPVMAKDILPSAVVRLMKARPGINITITELRNSQLLPAFRKGQFDFVVGILDSEELDDSFVTKILFYDELVAAVRPNHPLTMMDTIEPKDLLRFPWIYPNRGTAHRRRMDTYFQAARLRPPLGTIVGGSNSFIKSTLMQSDFVAVLPEDVVRDDNAQGTLTAISLDSPILRRPLGIIHRGKKTLTPLGRTLMLEIERACSRMKAGQL